MTNSIIVLSLIVVDYVLTQFQLSKFDDAWTWIFGIFILFTSGWLLLRRPKEVFGIIENVECIRRINSATVSQNECHTFRKMSATEFALVVPLE